MGTTVDDMVERILASMEGTFGPNEIDSLNGAMTDVATSFTSTNAVNGLRVGAIIEIEYELMRVTSVSGNTVSVTRGYRNTTAAAHGSSAIVDIQPRWSRSEVMQNMREEIRSWPTKVFQEATDQVTVDDSADIMVYEFATAADVADYIRTLEIRSRAPASTRLDYRRAREARIVTGIPAADFTSTGVLQLTHKYSGVTQYDVTYAKKFDTSTAWATTTDLQDDVGIPVEMEDIVEIGTMARLLVGRETRRVQRNRQGQPRNAQEVREGSTYQVGSAYRAQAKERINEEAGRLLSKWPIRLR